MDNRLSFGGRHVCKQTRVLRCVLVRFTQCLSGDMIDDRPVLSTVLPVFYCGWMIERVEERREGPLGPE
ncbi:hypothetical protein CSUI_010622 [Cystoisospora suis]|uniref:Uncharacterized protein n=1 Tax=Cystoisospora suis TaxID=483139 RepID=A0A2C6KGQ7_9APIC|nr:hypothetical protein CSUI_010622 [Cystoisospora suis]